MGTYDEISRHLDQAETTMKNAEAQLAKFQTVRTELGELVGRAVTAEGWVTVEWTPRGLGGLDINPRAMRLPSTDLAEEIKKAIAEATADLREKARAAMENAGLTADPPPTPAQMQEQLRQVREQFIGAGRQSAATIDRAVALRRGGPTR